VRLRGHERLADLRRAASARAPSRRARRAACPAPLTRYGYWCVPREARCTSAQAGLRDIVS
jgi:hypothetical protein